MKKTFIFVLLLFYSILSFAQIEPVKENIKTENVSCKNDSLNNIKTNQLKEVSVIGNGEEKQLMKIEADKTTYFVKNNPLLSAGSMSEAIKKLPAVRVDPNGEIYLHGKNTAIYIDGIPCSLSGRDLYNYIQSLPANTAEKIEIIANPGASYEANTSGGIINIVTGVNNFQYFSATLNLGYGINKDLYNKYAPSIVLNGQFKSINWLIQTGYSNQGRNATNINDRTFYSFSPEIKFYQNSNSDFLDRNFYFRPMINFKINETSNLIFNYSFTHSNNVVNTYSSSFTENLSPAIIYTNSYRNVDKSSNNEFIAKYKTQLDSLGKNLQVTAYYTLFNKNSLGKSIQNQDNSNSYSINNLDLKLQNFYIKYDFELPLKHLKFEVNTGGKYNIFNTNDLGKYRLNDIDSTIFDNPLYTRQLTFNYKESNFALYAELKKNFGKLDVSAGLRFENLNYQSKVLENDTIVKEALANLFPTVHLLYKITPAINLVSSYSRKISMPSYYRLDPNSNDYFDSYTISTGNLYMKPNFYDNYAFNITAFDFLQLDVEYSFTKNINLMCSTTSNQSLIVTQTYSNFKNIHNLDINVSFPVPFSIFTKGIDILKKPLNLGELSYLYFYVEYSKEKIQDYPYFKKFKPRWTFDVNSQILLPYKLNLNIFYEYLTKGTFRVYQWEKPIQHAEITLSRTFLNNKIDALVEATIPSKYYVSYQTSNLNILDSESNDCASIWFKIAYRFGTYKNHSEIGIDTEKADIK